MEFKVPNGGAIITNIQEIEEYMFIDEHHPNVSMKGLLVETSFGNLKLIIEDGSQCCESSGQKFLETPDDISKYIGAKLIRLKTVEIPSKTDDGGETQLKITTSAGVLQYAVYNIHNGYYCHAVFRQIFDKKELRSL